MRRFKSGDTVECWIACEWKPGTVVATDYQEPGWLTMSPYQVKLDTGRHIHAQFDTDSCIRMKPGTEVCEDHNISLEDEEFHTRKGKWKDGEGQTHHGDQADQID